MKYTLMHKDIPVIDIDIDQATKVIADMGPAHNKAHLPPGVFHEDTVERGPLNQWWVLRAIRNQTFFRKITYLFL
jgi:hypothetical protein